MISLFDNSLFSRQIKLIYNIFYCILIIVNPRTYCNDILVISWRVEYSSSWFHLIFTFKRTYTVSVIFLFTEFFLPNIFMHLATSDKSSSSIRF